MVFSGSESVAGVVKVIWSVHVNNIVDDFVVLIWTIASMA